MHEMIQMPDENMYPGVRKYIHDYGMNLVVLKDLNQEEEELFVSDFRLLVRYLRNCNDPVRQMELMRQGDDLDHRKETMMAMAALTRDERYTALAGKEEENLVAVICNMIQECGTGCTSEMIYEKLFQVIR